MQIEVAFTIATKKRGKIRKSSLVELKISPADLFFLILHINALLTCVEPHISQIRAFGLNKLNMRFT